MNNLKGKIALVTGATQGIGRGIAIELGRSGATVIVNYAATKAGQISMVKTLARTGAPFNINVNAVAPGIVDTELLHKTHGDDSVEALAKTIPLGIGNDSDIDNAVAFLCSDDARYITGITLNVNGGKYFR